VATSPSGAPTATFRAEARDVLSCGHRWLGVGEVVEFRVTDDNARAIDILRSFETADGAAVTAE